MKISRVFILFISLIILSRLPFTESPHPTLVIRGVTVINTTNGVLQPAVDVLISGDRISSVGPQGSTVLPEGVEVVQATGKFLIPGLWDMHVHWYDERYFPLFLANGVTGIRIMWGEPDHFKQREEISKGSLIGPRMIISSPIIDGPRPVMPDSISVSNEAEARQVVRNVREMGYDFVKVYQLLPREAYFAIADEAKELGIPFAGHIPSSISATEASNAGQRSVEHLGGGLGVLLACSNKEEQLRKEREKAYRGFSRQQPPARSRLGAFGSFHKKVLEAYDVEKASALFALFVKNSTWQCPTLTVLRSGSFLDDKNFTNDPRLKYMTKAEVESWELKNNPIVSSNTPEDWAIEKKVYHKELEIVGAMRRAGVEMLAGTDVLNPFCFPGFSLHDELGLLVEAGLTPMEALQTATYNPAKFLGLTDSLGTIDTGKIADLVLLEADPLEDISNTRKITAVVIGGKYFPKASLDEMLAKIEILANQMRGTPLSRHPRKPLTVH
jgi:hypothetical protein